MNRPYQLLCAAAAAGLLATPALAAPVSFTLEGASFTPGAGYGVDANENGGVFLNAAFGPLGSFPFGFGLVVGTPVSRSVGTVSFAEPNAHGGINSNELDGLGVSLTLDLGGALDAPVVLQGSGAATGGSVSDSGVDYSLTWLPRSIDFGDGGLLEISIEELKFEGIGSQTLLATFTLLEAPAIAQTTDLPPTTQDVPEPASLALLAGGLVGLGWSRRRRAS